MYIYVNIYKCIFANANTDVHNINKYIYIFTHGTETQIHIQLHVCISDTKDVG